MQQEQIDEWKSSPVTEKLRDLIAKQIEFLSATSVREVFTPFDAQRTHEVLCSLNAAVDTWEIALEALNGDWAFFEEDEDE